MAETADLPAAVLEKIEVGDCVEIQWKPRDTEHQGAKRLATGWVVWLGIDNNGWRVEWEQGQFDRGRTDRQPSAYEKWPAVEVDSIGAIKHLRIDLRRVVRVERFESGHPRHQALIEQDQSWIDEHIWSMAEWRKRRANPGSTEGKMLAAGIPMPKMRNRKQDCPHRHPIGLGVTDNNDYPYCPACGEVVPERRGEHAF